MNWINNVVRPKIRSFLNPAAKKEVWEDMKLVLRLLQEA